MPDSIETELPIKPLGAYVTPREHALIVQAAKAKRMSMRAFTVASTLDAAKQVVQSQTEAK